MANTLGRRMETEKVVVSWSNVGKYCRIVFFFQLPIEQQEENKISDLKILEREQVWDIADMYGMPEHKKGNRNIFLDVEKARTLWERLQKEHGFYLAEIEGVDDESR